MCCLDTGKGGAAVIWQHLFRKEEVERGADSNLGEVKLVGDVDKSLIMRPSIYKPPEQLIKLSSVWLILCSYFRERLPMTVCSGGILP